MSNAFIHPISKVIVPTITFFNADNTIPEAPNEILIRHILANQPDALFPMGSTGEGLLFRDHPEIKQKFLIFLGTLVKKLNSSIPIIIGVYGNTAQEALQDIELSLKAIPEAGLVIPPPTDKQLDEQQQIQFYSEIFENCQAPIYLYNNPGTFGKTTIALGTLKKLMQYPNFYGIKDSSGTIEQKKIYLEILSEKYTVSCGKEGMLAEFLSIIPVEKRKLAGIVPSISNVVNTCHNIFQLGLEGKDTEMLALQDELNAFRSKIYDSKVGNGKSQRGVKLALAYLYKNMPEISFPQTVRPKMIREIEPETVESIQNTTESTLQKGHITLISP